MQTIADLTYITRDSGPVMLDMYLPDDAAGELPLVMWIPGGGWRNCNRKSGEQAAADLTSEGYVVASIDYRVSSVATAPANILDCRAAVRWLRAHAADYHIDTSRIGAFGSSAGGHLAALLGVSTGVDALEERGEHSGESCAVQAVCSYCGVFDVARYADREAWAKFDAMLDVADGYMGGRVAQHIEMAKLMSPMQHIGQHCPPHLLVHCHADPVVPVIESIEYQAALCRAGIDTTFRSLPGESHGWAHSLSRENVHTFFNRVLKG